MAENEQRIEQLTERYNKLNKRKIGAEANLETAQNHLDTLKKQAIEEYGTDDVEELKKMLDKMKAENERKRREYQESLDNIEKELAKVDEEFNAARESSNKGESA